MRSLTVSISLATLAASALVALACGVSLDPTPWTLDHREYSDRNGLPVLSPGNDTRINMQLLMLARKDSKARVPKDVEPESEGPLFSIRTFEAAYEDETADRPWSSADDGTRCQTQKSGEAAFVDAVKAATGLAEAERSALVEARAKILPACDKGVPSIAAALRTQLAQPSEAALAFVSYLAGAEAFYLGAFDDAATAFAGLGSAADPWLRETARYMAGRTLLNKAQAGAFDTFDMVGQPKVSDPAQLARAEVALNDYLTAYPDGRYAASARGLVRRLHWLAGDTARLATDYQMLIVADPSWRGGLSAIDVTHEIDAKLLAGVDVKDPTPLLGSPTLLAIHALRRMRAPADDKSDFPASALDAQASAFAGQPALFSFLKAARAYYVDKDPKTALAFLGPRTSDPALPSAVAFSREVLRGQALLAAGPTEATAAHWRALLPGATEPWQKEAVELGLAVTWERLGTIDKVFLPETRIDSPRIRAILLRQIAGPILLRMAMADPKSSADEQDLARDVLLYKEATRGQYANFLRDYDPDVLSRDGMTRGKAYLWDGKGETYVCPDLKAVVAGLAANPRSPSARLCLADFVRVAGFDGREDDKPPANELGGGKPIFPGEPYSRLEVYKSLIADRATPPREQAYALFRAINCYAPTSINHCGGPGVPKSQREAWYRTLKTKHGSTPWAKELKYYW
ncbi:hypothetical protein [uncultured Alsobacter sp.]|uniref:hypothetical protein n=1 Tax=uncultured Alsobacter sp. TaxID=1748258 RepID=UPI0025EBCCB5|nr:hypothetical protein [uncultured Alsobacter sp.]